MRVSIHISITGGLQRRASIYRHTYMYTHISPSINIHMYTCIHISMTVE